MITPILFLKSETSPDKTGCYVMYVTGALCCGTAAGGSEASLGSIYPGGPGPAGIDESYSTTGAGDDLRDLFLLCPKCVLLRHAHPGCLFLCTMSVSDFH